MTVVVEAPARLHLGLLDTNGDLGRLYGGIGVALARPHLVLEAEPADGLLVEGPETERVTAFAQRFLDRYPLPHGVRLHLKTGFPSHVGLGSGTQLALAVGMALARLGGKALSVPELAVTMGRGLHSGIGIATFQHGGFIVDGGHRVASRVGGVPVAAKAEVPPLLFRQPFPADWCFVLLVPAVDKGISGAKEQQAFDGLPTPPATLAEKISRLLLMKLLPALVEGEIAPFGQALTEIQRLVGDSFAAIQGSRYANALSGQLVDFSLSHGAAGAGQSSWGPTIYALVQGESQAMRLEMAGREFLAAHGGGQTFCAYGDNQGARVSQYSAD
jgi:beta-ribofuranosylaminobenzene 5'-phosphate synthase